MLLFQNRLWEPYQQKQLCHGECQAVAGVSLLLCLPLCCTTCACSRSVFLLSGAAMLRLTKLKTL
jgi:hypothetical protein